MRKKKKSCILPIPFGSKWVTSTSKTLSDCFISIAYLERTYCHRLMEGGNLINIQKVVIEKKQTNNKIKGNPCKLMGYYRNRIRCKQA